MSDQDLIEILANLDFLVEGSKTKSLQDNDYDSYTEKILEEIAKNMGRRIPVQEIQAALEQELRIRGFYPVEAFKYLLVYGSSELSLDADRRKLVEKHLQLLRLQGRHSLPKDVQHRWLRSAVSTTAGQRPLGTSTTSNLRSRTRSASVAPRQPSQRGQKTRKRRPTRKEVLEPRTEVCETPDLSFVSESPNPDIAETNSDSNIRPLHEAEDATIDIDRVSGHGPEHRATVSPPTLLGPSELENSALLENLMTCNARCEALKAERDDIDRASRSVKSLGKVSQDTDTLFRQLTREVSVLKRKLADRTTVGRYLCIGGTYDTENPSHHLTAQFAKLKRSISAVLVVNGSYKPSIGTVKGASADLDELLFTLFGQTLMNKPEMIPLTFQPLTSYDLIQALVGAAVYAWVFRNDFHTYVMEQSPLLHGYRHLIKISCGEEALSNLDFAVHRYLIEHENVQSVIVARVVQNLIGRLTEALQPLFSTDTRGLATQKLKTSLNSTLRLAVQIRTETLIAGDRFEAIWPVTGSSFDDMEMEALEQSAAVGSRNVRLSICAGIRAFSQDKAMVDYGALGTGGSSHATPKYVIKASVLC